MRNIIHFNSLANQVGSRANIMGCLTNLLLSLTKFKNPYIVAIAKFCNPLYATDASLTCGAHLCH
jgi:hypothetical protein